MPSIGASRRTPIRSPARGAAAMAEANDVVGVGGDHQAAGSWRASTSRPAAASATQRAITPLVASPSPSTVAAVTRPLVGLSPTRPVQDAGTRIDPPPSAAWAMGAIPAATATAEPPEEPPGERVVSHGLRVMPSASLSVKLMVPNSEVVVFPSSTKPASENRRTTGSDAVGRARPAPDDP